MWMSIRSTSGPLLFSNTIYDRLLVSDLAKPTPNGTSNQWLPYTLIADFRAINNLGEIASDGKPRTGRLRPSGTNTHFQSSNCGTGENLRFRGNKQKALAEFLKAIDEGKVKPGDILLVEAVDRLSRKGIRATQKIVNTILEAGVDIAILSPVEKVYRSADTNDIGGAIELAAFAYQAHIYSANLSYRIKSHFDEARKQARANGKALSGHLPAWLEDKDTPKPEAVKTIKYIFRRVIDGIGAHRLTAELEEKGMKSFGVSGRWNQTYLRAFIRNRAVLGEYQPHINDEQGKRQPIGEVIEGYYPKIIDEKTWLAANAALDNRATERGPSRDFVNLFTGIARHGFDKCPAHVYTYQQTRADGQKVTIRRLKSYYAQQKTPGSSTATVDLPHFEAAFLGYLKEVQLPEDTDSTAVDDLKAANSLIVRNKKRIVEILDAIETGDEAVAALVVPLKALQAERKTLEQQVKEFTARANQDTDGGLAAARKISELDLDDQNNRQLLREAIKQAVESLTIYPVKMGSQKHSTVVCLCEIAFKSGHRRLIVQINDWSMAIDSKIAFGSKWKDNEAGAKRFVEALEKTFPQAFPTILR